MGGKNRKARFLSDPFYDNNYNRIFNELYSPLCHYCMKLVNDRETAEDIVQEKFVYLWENRQRLVNIVSIKAYLYKAVRNQSLNFLKKHYPKIMDNSIEELSEIIQDKGLPTPMELLESKELENLLEKALESLPVRCRTIFTMKRFAEKSNREIAKSLQISIKTVEAQITIALKKLRAFVSVNWEL